MTNTEAATQRLGTARVFLVLASLTCVFAGGCDESSDDSEGSGNAYGSEYCQPASEADCLSDARSTLNVLLQMLASADVRSTG